MLQKSCYFTKQTTNCHHIKQSVSIFYPDRVFFKTSLSTTTNCRRNSKNGIHATRHNRIFCANPHPQKPTPTKATSATYLLPVDTTASPSARVWAGTLKPGRLTSDCWRNARLPSWSTPMPSISCKAVRQPSICYPGGRSSHRTRKSSTASSVRAERPTTGCKRHLK